MFKKLENTKAIKKKIVLFLHISLFPSNNSYISVRERGGCFLLFVYKIATIIYSIFLFSLSSIENLLCYYTFSQNF